MRQVNVKCIENAATGETTGVELPATVTGPGVPIGGHAPKTSGRTMPAIPRPADRRAVWAGVLAWSASGDRSNSAGTAGTKLENPRKPLSLLGKSVPVSSGDKPESSGDSGDKSLLGRAKASAPWFCLVPGAPESRLCCAKVLPHPPPTGGPTRLPPGHRSSSNKAGGMR
jgi:hypothetical protein